MAALGSDRVSQGRLRKRAVVGVKTSLGRWAAPSCSDRVGTSKLLGWHTHWFLFSFGFAPCHSYTVQLMCGGDSLHSLQSFVEGSQYSFVFHLASFSVHPALHRPSCKWHIVAIFFTTQLLPVMHHSVTLRCRKGRHQQKQADKHTHTHTLLYVLFKFMH